MQTYKKRNRIDEKAPVKTGATDEQELVLRLKKDELLDKHILLPHAEVNPIVYDAVNRFVEKSSARTLTLTIMTDDVSAPIQDIFTESYRSHYEDEYQKTVRFLRRRYIRAACLLVASILAFWLSGLLTNFALAPVYIVTILSQVSVFCIWEIGYTHFARSDAAAERDRITRARNAQIQFHCHLEPDRSAQ